MAMHEGDFGGHRGKREAMETVQRNDAMAKREAFEAGRIRDRLEKQSSVGQRASIAAVLRKAGVGTGGRTTPRDPAWAEAGYNAPPEPPKRRAWLGASSKG